MEADLVLNWEPDLHLPLKSSLGVASIPGQGEGIFHYRFMPHPGAYVGWGWNRHSSDNSFAGNNMDFKETGYTFGLEFQHPLSNTPVDFYIQGGDIYNHIEIENSAGDITADSDHGLGWQAKVGISFNLSSDKWVIKPGVRYRSLSRDIEFGNTTTGIDLPYFNFGVGISSSL